MSLTVDLNGRRALVTGASSAGFGAHFAMLLARSGADVIVAARRLEALEALVEAIRADGHTARAVAIDVTNTASVKAALDQAGVLDIVVNNAGVTYTAAALDQTEEDFDRIISTNLKGTWTVSLEAARLMVAAGNGGSIINITSITALRNAGSVTPYAVSKAGVVQMTKQLALEWARYDIRVNALAPGYFATDLNREFFESDAGRAMVKRIPQRRLGNYTDLDGAFLLLASDASRYMTGSVIAIDGGHLLSTL